MAHTAFITNEVTPILKCSRLLQLARSLRTRQTLYIVLSLQMREIAKSGWPVKDKNSKRFLRSRDFLLCGEPLIGHRRVRSQQRRLMRAFGG
jgi:hypothetical protein